LAILSVKGSTVTAEGALAAHEIPFENRKHPKDTTTTAIKRIDLPPNVAVAKGDRTLALLELSWLERLRLARMLPEGN
jgi:hypothetical protein